LTESTCSSFAAGPHEPDGRGSWLDKVFVERLRPSVKYEQLHLRAYTSTGQREMASSTRRDRTGVDIVLTGLMK
jgi:hypothetical protein